MAMTNTQNNTQNNIKNSKKLNWFQDVQTEAPFAYAYPELFETASQLDRVHPRPRAGFGDPQLNLRALPHLARPR